MCLSAIYWAGIRGLYFGCSSQAAEQFGFEDVLLYRELWAERQSRQLKSVQLLEHEAQHAFEEWTMAGGTASSLADWK